MHEQGFTDPDFGSLWAAVSDWIRAAGPCGYFHVGDLQHWLQGLPARGPVSEAVRIWDDGAGPLAIALCGLFGEAFQVLVAPHLRGTPTEDAFLLAAEARTRRLLRAGGDAETVPNIDVYACDQVRRARLERLGFERYRVWGYLAERDLQALPECGPPAGYRLILATAEQGEDLARVRREAFGEAWPPGQYRRHVLEGPGADQTRDVAAVDARGEITALATIHLDRVTGVGLFEPVATRPAFQRRGLARAVLAYGLQIMAEHGLTTACVGYDATNAAAGALYAGLGFAVAHETLGYRRGDKQRV